MGKKPAPAPTMAKQGPSRDKIDLNGNKLQSMSSKTEPKIGMTDTDDKGRKVDSKREPFKDPKDVLKKRVKGGGMAPLPQTKRRELPPKVPRKKRIEGGGRLKKMKTVSGIKPGKKKKTKKANLSKTIIGVKKKKSQMEIIREQLLSVPTDEGDGDWFL